MKPPWAPWHQPTFETRHLPASSYRWSWMGQNTNTVRELSLEYGRGSLTTQRSKPYHHNGQELGRALSCTYPTSCPSNADKNGLPMFATRSRREMRFRKPRIPQFCWPKRNLWPGPCTHEWRWSKASILQTYHKRTYFLIPFDWFFI